MWRGWVGVARVACVCVWRVVHVSVACGACGYGVWCMAPYTTRHPHPRYVPRTSCDRALSGRREMGGLQACKPRNGGGGGPVDGRFEWEMVGG